MSLEALYNQAKADTYVGSTKTRPAVNFLDGQPKTRSNTKLADQFQKEFTRNDDNNGRRYISGGAQGVVRGADERLTRWTDKSFELAFGGEGPATLSTGYFTNKFRTAVGPSGAQTVHKYAPDNTRYAKTYKMDNSSAASRINASPSGAPSF